MSNSRDDNNKNKTENKSSNNDNENFFNTMQRTLEGSSKARLERKTRESEMDMKERDEIRDIIINKVNEKTFSYGYYPG